jgi:hypothetical protein
LAGVSDVLVCVCESPWQLKYETVTLFIENVCTVDATDIHDSADTSVCLHTTFLWYVLQAPSNVCKSETAHDTLCVMTYSTFHSVLQT